MRPPGATRTVSPTVSSWRRDRTDRPCPAHRYLARQEFQQIANGLAPTTDRHALQHLGDQHKQGDDESGEQLPDGGRSHDRDCHRQLHRHAPFDDVLKRLLEDRPAPNREAERTDHAKRRKGLPDTKPHGSGGDRDNADASGFGPFERVVVPVLMIVVGIIRMGVLVVVKGRRGGAVFQ